VISRVNKVLIVGGGIGGLSLAIGLRARGMAVDVVEIKSAWTVYGVGIIQQANVVRAMAQLGIVDRYLSAAFPFYFVGIYNPSGELIAKLPGDRLAGQQYPPLLGISRLSLHLVLTSLTLERGTRVRLGLTVERLEQSSSDVKVWFTDGTVDRYDLVVGADGLYSKIRVMVFPNAPTPRFTGQSVWRHNFRRRPEIDHLAAYNGRHASAGLVPLSEDLMYMYVTSIERGNPWMEPTQLHDLMKQRMKGFGGLIGELKSEINDPEKVVYKPMEVVLVHPPWYAGRVVLIGDAAHATTPHLGQGAGMAIEDAVVLSEELGGDGSVEERLDRYMKRRYERCKFIVESSELIGKYQMDEGAVPIDEKSMVEQMQRVTAQPI
jgi:2-polyprenyl-6-methoxyphenol hydroxylase-like FAD-dependent oxidoreductase